MLKDKSFSELQIILDNLVDDFDIEFDDESLGKFFDFDIIKQRGWALRQCMDGIERGCRYGVDSIVDDGGEIYGIYYHTFNDDDNYIIVDGIHSRDLTKDELIDGIENILESDIVREDIFNGVESSLNNSDSNKDVESFLEDETPYLDFKVDVKKFKELGVHDFEQFSTSNFNECFKISVR